MRTNAAELGMKVYDQLFMVLKRILAIGEFLLLLRLVLKFAQASSETFVVKYLYGATDLLVWPFYGIFPDYILFEHSLDMATIAAMIGYILAFFILFKILRLFAKSN